ncbi:C40 family peptidase [Methylotenera sp.]|uniref:C40 family peptidase n=1 Tax=Methylotenera sp. TaxID=2051956 RepID=UPI0027330E18|nr:C40 family peptidase [Methylotenera sp.]MDP3210878.1 C40 family peptidase [Methylotenera sp.]
MSKLTYAHYLICIALALVSASCAATPNGLSNAYTTDLAQAAAEKDHAEDSQDWPDRAREVLVNALSLTGIAYKYGGSTPETGFDCSGFVRYVYQQATSLTLPHGAKAISQLGKTVSKSELQPGDLVFFNTLKSAFSHVGIYVGNNRFIHSPSSGGGVRVDDMQSSYWNKRFNGAQRIESEQKKD